METRNFYIIVASICIGLTIFWLTLYNIVLYDIDYEEYVSKNVENITGEEPDDEDPILKIEGSGVKDDLVLTMSDLTSDDYTQIIDGSFRIKTTVEYHDYVYSGVSLWSILEEEDLLEDDASTFNFVGADGYEPPFPLPLDVAEDNPNDVILAYEKDGEPLFEQGPVRSVIDHDALKPYYQYSSQYSVQQLVIVEIE